MTRRPLRVLMVSDVFFPRVNGVSTSIDTFRRTLARLDVAVRVIAPRYGDEPDTPDVVRVPGRRVPRDPEDRLAAWGAMRETVRREAQDSDLVHVQTPFAAHYAGLLAARRQGLPVLGTYHTFFEAYLHHYLPFLPAPLLRAAARRLSRTQCNALDAVVVPSTAMLDRLRAYGVGPPIHVLPTGVSPEAFRARDGRAFRALYGIAAERPVALYVGRVAHEKNIAFLLEATRAAARRVPDLLLLVAGEGPALEALRRRADELCLGTHVRFLGYLDREWELPNCYAAADAFVFASRTETQGLVLLEAMAAGTPVVSLSAMGTTDILGPGRGCIAAPDHPEAFAAVLVKVLGDATLRSRLQSEALDYAGQWHADAMAARMAKLYEDLLARKRTEWNGLSKARPASGV